MNQRWNRRGQVTIFIIIAIIIVAGALLVYSFFPDIQKNFGLTVQSPQQFIQSCIEGEIRDSVGLLSSQGGSLEPQHYILYNDEKIEYLCYTNEFYKNCVMQQPLLKEHIESEILGKINTDVDKCFSSLKASYEGRGYNVAMTSGKKTIELLPQKVISTFNYSLTLTKGEDVQRYNSFNVVVNNNLYELIAIGNSILGWETTYGDSETTTYMNYYHNLKVEKKIQGDGTTIYILTDRNTEDKFQFASRSVVMPPGYGVGQ
jgi:hypothetical protein